MQRKSQIASQSLKKNLLRGLSLLFVGRISNHKMISRFASRFKNQYIHLHIKIYEKSTQLLTQNPFSNNFSTICDLHLFLKRFLQKLKLSLVRYPGGLTENLYFSEFLLTNFGLRLYIFSLGACSRNVCYLCLWLSFCSFCSTITAIFHVSHCLCS